MEVKERLGGVDGGREMPLTGVPGNPCGCPLRGRRR